MLKRLQMTNFTVFEKADFEFGPGLNVVVGTNGTGKSHVLKLGYAVEFAREEVKNGRAFPHQLELRKPEDRWSSELFFNLPRTFQTSDLKHLVATTAVNQVAKIEVEFLDGQLESEAVKLEIGAAENSIRISGGREVANEKVEVVSPVFIPAKEVLTLSWMLPVYGQIMLPVEGNYLDLLKQLRGFPLRQPVAAAAIAAITEILGGEVKEANDKCYLVGPADKQTEMSMVAEGLRKFGTLQKLLANGSLTPKSTLFWDEPEANLNPALLKKLAEVLAALARQGFQIILATHSLFLLKQLHILSRQKTETALPIRYFGLTAEPGQPTQVVMKTDLEQLPDVVALDEELEQADALTLVFAQDDAGNQ